MIDYLAGKEILLVLDNFEQIIAGATIVSQILASSKTITILVTSRIALFLRGEREYPVLSLSLPEKGEPLAVEQLLEFEALNLFVDRARAIHPSFELTLENAGAVLGICRRLDGLPLAIEIAAARIRILPPQAILNRLDRSLRLLVGGAADLPTRQQTLRSAIDWSYDLLENEERILFARLSVFGGGFTLESAEGVCNAQGEFDILSGVETLVRNNLLRQVDSVADTPRFDMLLTIREFGREKLDESGDLLALRQSHLTYFTQQSEIYGLLILGNQSTKWLKQIDQEHDNYRGALTHGLKTEGGQDMVVQICLYLSWFWYRYGHFHEGRDWCERALSAVEDSGGVVHVMALYAAGVMAMWEGDLDIAAQRAQEAVKISDTISIDIVRSLARQGYGVTLINQGKDKDAYPQLVAAAELFDQVDNNYGKALALVHLANAALGLGLYDEALARLDQAKPIVSEVDDPWQLGFWMNNYGEVARAQGQYDKAEAYYKKTEEYFREADAASDQARLMYTLAVVAQHKGQYEKAKILFHQSLSEFRELGNRRGIAECLAGMAGLAAEQGDAGWAVTLYSAAEALITSFGAAWWPADRVEHKRALQLMKSSLAPGEFVELWESGQAMSMEQAISFVLRDREAD